MVFRTGAEKDVLLGRLVQILKYTMVILETFNTVLNQEVSSLEVNILVSAVDAHNDSRTRKAQHLRTKKE